MSNSSNMSHIGLRRTRSARVGSGSTLNNTGFSSMSRAHEAPPSFPFRVPTPTRTTRPTAPPPPKAKFTPEEQLNILKRLKSRDFIRKRGIQQFQDEKDRIGTVRSKSKNSTIEALSKKKDKHAVMPLPPLSSPSQPLPNFAEFLGGPEGKHYAQMPDHIKLFDKLMVLHINVFKLLYTHATRSANATFSRMLKPRNIRLLIRRVVQVTHILQKFLKLGSWDKAHAFMPSKTQMRGPGRRRSYLHNAVKDQNKTRLAILQAGQVMEKLRQFMKGKKPEDLDPKIRRFKGLLDAWEEHRENLNTLNKQWDYLEDVAEELEEDSDSDMESMTITSESDTSDSGASDSDDSTETSSTD